MTGSPCGRSRGSSPARLIRELYDTDGEVCAIGAYGRAKGVDLTKYDPEEGEHEDVGVEGGMPRLVAWKVVEQNDYDCKRDTPEERYQQVLAWVEALLDGK